MSIFIYCNPPNALRSPQAGYSGYECELSIHLATAYISFAPVRVLRTGAFCFFQLFSEKRTQEPSPERVRSERGREDKPLTPVLYSTREGGELYGAIFFRQGKNTTSVRRISKENFGRRSEKPPPHSCETRSTRSYFFGFERKRTRAAFHNGRIRKRYVLVKNELLAEALTALPERKRDIVLLSYFLDMSDTEIGELLNVVRTTVFRHRKSALAKIKQYLEGKADDEHR